MLHIRVAKVADVMVSALGAILALPGSQRIFYHRAFAMRAGERRMLQQFSFASRSWVETAEARDIFRQTWTRSVVDHQVPALVLTLRVPRHHITIAPISVATGANVMTAVTKLSPVVPWVKDAPMAAATA